MTGITKIAGRQFHAGNDKMTNALDPIADVCDLDTALLSLPIGDACVQHWR